LKWKAKPRQLASGTESRVTTEWKTSSRGTRNVDTGRWATFSARTAKPRLSTDASLTRATTAESSGATPARSRAAGPGVVASATTADSWRAPSAVTTAWPAPAASTAVTACPARTSMRGWRARASAMVCRPPFTVKLRGYSLRRVPRVLKSIAAGKASALWDGTADSMGPRTFP